MKAWGLPQRCPHNGTRGRKPNVGSRKCRTKGLGVSFSFFFFFLTLPSDWYSGGGLCLDCTEASEELK